MEEFLKELYLLCKKHKIGLSACGCCDGISVDDGINYTSLYTYFGTDSTAKDLHELLKSIKKDSTLVKEHNEETKIL